MFISKETIFSLSSIFLLTSTQVKAHTKLEEPAGALRPKEDEYCQAKWAKSSPCCGSRDRGRPSATNYRRGQQVALSWPRNNHPGGFISLSLVPFDKSDESFDLYAQNVIQINCNEQTCMSGEACEQPGLGLRAPCKEPYGGDNAQYRPTQCQQSFTIPDWVQDGQYTVLWRWYGTGGWYGDEYGAQGDYVSCIDFTVTGGNQVTSKPAAYCPVLKLGDVHDWTATQCTHIGGGNKPDWCPEQGCKADYKKSAPAGFENCVGRSSQPGSASPPPSSPSPSPSPSSQGQGGSSDTPSKPTPPSPAPSPKEQKERKEKNLDDTPSGDKLWGFPICKNPVQDPAVDKNGVKYGYENNQSCVVPEFTTQDSRSLDDDQAGPVVQPTCTGERYGFPCCLKPVTAPAVDKNGVRYGYEDGRSCIV